MIEVRILRRIEELLAFGVERRDPVRVVLVNGEPGTNEALGLSRQRDGNHFD